MPKRNNRLTLPGATEGEGGKGMAKSLGKGRVSGGQWLEPNHPRAGRGRVKEWTTGEPYFPTRGAHPCVPRLVLTHNTTVGEGGAIWTFLLSNKFYLAPLK